MTFFWFNRGLVRSFNTTIQKNTTNWTPNKKCRSLRVRNVGNDPCLVGSNGINEPLDLTEIITYGGYPYSFRFEELDFKFEGTGTNPKIVIVQDIQIEEPTIWQGVGEFIKQCFK